MKNKKLTAGMASVLVGFAIAAIVVVLSIWQPLADAAGGYIKWTELAPSVRSRVYQQALGTFGAGSGTTIGSGGVISAIVVQDGTTPGPQIQTSSISTFAWPQKLFLDLIDSDDTVTCASVTVSGRDQFGTPVSEVVTSLTESGAFTNTVFELVNRVVGTTCICADHDCTATDTLTVQAPMTHLGMRSAFTSEDDFISVCLTDDSGNTMLCAELDDGGAADVQSAIDVTKTCGPNGDQRCYTLNAGLSNLFQGVTPEAGADILRIEFRPRR